MTDRIHLLISQADKARYRELAAREGKSLSVWLREAAEHRYSASVGARSLASRQDLDAFFDACDARETGSEPDWEAHRTVIEESITGSGPTHARPSRPRGKTGP